MSTAGIGESGGVKKTNEEIQAEREAIEGHRITLMQKGQAEMTEISQLALDSTYNLESWLANEVDVENPAPIDFNARAAEALPEETYTAEMQELDITNLSDIGSKKNLDAAQKILRKACQNFDLDTINTLTRAGVVPSQEIQNEFGNVLVTADVDTLMQQIRASIIRS